MREKIRSVEVPESAKSNLILLSAVVVAALANGLLQRVATDLALPLFLDSIGTAVIALCFGPLAGVCTGLLSNLAAELFQGFPGHLWPFAIVNMATGLTVGVMGRKMDFYRGSVVALAVVIVTVINALLGTLVVTLVFSGITSQPVDYIVTALTLTGQSIFSAAFLARLPVNFIDKTVAILIALAVWRSQQNYRSAETG